MRERGEIAARADGSLRRNDRCDAAVEHRDEKVERLRLDAGMTGRERVRSQDAGSADKRNRKRFARSCSVASDEIELERNGIGRVDGNACKASEACRDAVDRFAAIESGVDELARTFHALTGGGRNANRRAVSDRLDILERQMAAIEPDWVQNFDQSGCVGLANGGPFWITIVSWSRSAMLRGSRPCHGVPSTQIESRPPCGAVSVAACVQLKSGPQISKNWPSVKLRFTGDSI